MPYICSMKYIIRFFFALLLTLILYPLYLIGAVLKSLWNFEAKPILNYFKSDFLLDEDSYAEEGEYPKHRWYYCSFQTPFHYVFGWPTMTSKRPKTLISFR